MNTKITLQSTVWLLAYLWHNRTATINAFFLLCVLGVISITYIVNQHYYLLNGKLEIKNLENRVLQAKQEIEATINHKKNLFNYASLENNAISKLETIRQLAKKNNILIVSAKYALENKDSYNLQIFRINQEFIAPYPKVRRFLSEIQEHNIFISNVLMQRPAINEKLINTTATFLVYLTIDDDDKS